MNTTVSARMKRNFPPFKPGTRDPEVVRPQEINIFRLPGYKPEGFASVRPGADDHLRVRSRGVPT